MIRDRLRRIERLAAWCTPGHRPGSALPMYKVLLGVISLEDPTLPLVPEPLPDETAFHWHRRLREAMGFAN
jgi:hypothetical protein